MSTQNINENSNFAQVPLDNINYSDKAGESVVSGESFDLFLKASQASDEITMMSLLSRVVSETKLSFVDLKFEIPKLVDSLNEKNIAVVFEQSQKNLEMLENELAGNKSKLSSKICNAFALVSSALLFIAAPSPLTATFFVTSVIFTVDSLVSTYTDNPSIMEKASEGFIKLMDSIQTLDSMPDMAKSLISTVLVMVGVVGAVYLASKGGTAALNTAGFNFAAQSSTRAGAMMSKDSMVRLYQFSAGVSEVADVGSGVSSSWFQKEVQLLAAENSVLQSELERTDVDVNVLIDSLEKIISNEKLLGKYV